MSPCCRRQDLNLHGVLTPPGPQPGASATSPHWAYIAIMLQSPSKQRDMEIRRCCDIVQRLGSHGQYFSQIFPKGKLTPLARETYIGRNIPLRLATSKSWKDASDGVQRTEWHWLVAFGNPIGKHGTPPRWWPATSRLAGAWERESPRTPASPGARGLPTMLSPRRAPRFSLVGRAHPRESVLLLIQHVGAQATRPTGRRG